MRRIAESELILNPDGSIYHLNLRPEHIADTIITVGDPDRVGKVSQYFDKIELRISKREFVTHTGWLGSKRISVISTGIGTDNIDIVFNELDALVNIDLNTRLPKSTHTALTIIRIGTSGCLQADIPIDAFLATSYGLGLEGLMHYYDYENSPKEKALLQPISTFFEVIGNPPIPPYLFAGNRALIDWLAGDFFEGITLTASGFYAPQGRELRLKTRFAPSYLDQLATFSSKSHRITNFEMETAGIYGLARLLGHKAISLNALIANRARGEFSKNPSGAVQQLIETTLERLVR